ncbi:MAG: HD domain-containing protein [Proteobacteria bacterium]|nr:HD domain-containing protein [Pseudomonadota bacterium]
MLTEAQKLDALAGLGVELNQVRDLDVLMEKILSLARRFPNADAGSIYIRREGFLDFSYTQNDTLKARQPHGKLIYSTFSIPVDKTSVAGYVAATGRLLNIPDVHEIPPTAPYGFHKEFDDATGFRTRSMLTLPMVQASGEVMGVLQVINAMDEAGRVVPFTAEGERMLSHFASIAAVALTRAQMTRALLLRMIRMSEMRDPKETGAHVNRVGAYSLEVYEAWAQLHGIPHEEVENNRDTLRMAAMLHDVGKVAISDLILKKPGRFNHEEYETMKQHTVLGARLFQDAQSDFDRAAALVAANHHERWDGQGYPGHVDITTGRPLPGQAAPAGGALGKRGEESPLFGRIVAVADVYDALVSVRVYKEAWSEEETLAAIRAGRGSQFDPELVDIFLSRLDVIRSIQDRYAEE